MSFKTEAIVLHSRTLRGADRMYEILTPGEGRLSVVARSAGRSTSKMAGHMSPFAHVRLMIGRGRQDHLAGATTIESHRKLRESWFDFILSSSLVELILKLNMAGDTAVTEFELLRATLGILEQEQLEQREKASVGRIFLWKLLSVGGWKPNLERCAACREPFNGDPVFYQALRGFMCDRHSTPSDLAISNELRTFLRDVLGNPEWKELVGYAGANGLAPEWLELSQRYYQDIMSEPLKSVSLLSYA